MSNREYRSWQAWLDEREGRPSRGDWYLMQVAAEVFRLPWRVWGKDPPGVELGRWRLTFGRGEDEKPPAETEESRREEMLKSQAVWRALVGGKTRPPTS